MKRFLFVALLLLTIVGHWPAKAFSQTSSGHKRIDPELMLARQAAADQGLFFALAQNDISAMTTLRDQGASPNTSLAILGLKAKAVFGDAKPILDQPFDPRSWPILHWAVYLGNEDAVKLLLRAGARVNAPDVYGATALHWASWGGRHNIGKLLLNNGASCKAMDIKRRTAKEWAIMMGQTDMIRLLDSRTCRDTAISDSDGDGVPDDQDQCPNTPYGAEVDDRGCWVVAYAGFFDFDKSVLRAQYLPAIQNAALVLKNYPDLLVEVEGHTDAIGTDEYNHKLGLRRAQAVKKVLLSNGVAANRLAVTSMGESRPIAGNESPGSRASNRRVEIHVSQPGATGGRAPLRAQASGQ